MLDTLARARDVGRTLDLSGCVYGPPHWEGGFCNVGGGYYELLAGLVRMHGFTRVCELGTHYGGATSALARGFAGAGRLVTVDVTALENPALVDARIERVQGDVFAARVVDDVAGRFDGPVDLLFVDIVHGYHQTKRALGLYANRLRPRLVVLDDIRLNGGMRALWAELAARHACVDASEITDRGGAGFGVLMPRLPLDEGDRWRAPLWALRREVAVRTPYSVKRQIGRALDALPARVRKLLDPS